MSLPVSTDADARNRAFRTFVQGLGTAAANVPQAEIVKRTGLARESVAQKMKPKDAPRWNRGAAADG